MFFEYPNDINCLTPELEYMDTQFMIGKGLLGAPVLYQGANTTDVYLPGDRWFDFFNGSVVHAQHTNGSLYENYPAPLNSTIPLFLRGGYVVQRQNVTGVYSTNDLSHNFSLTVGLKQTGQNAFAANGQMIGTNNFNETHIYEFCVLQNCLLNINVTGTTSTFKNYVYFNFTTQSTLPLESWILDEVKVYGLFSDDEEARAGLPEVRQIFYNGKLMQTTIANSVTSGAIIVKITNPLTINIGDVVTLVTYAYKAMENETA